MDSGLNALNSDVIPSDYVIDASIGIKLFVIEEGSDQALELFNRLTSEPPVIFYVPDYFYAECANVLWKYVQYYGYDAESARQDLEDLRGLALLSIPTADLIAPAFELALAYDLTIYDACYLALARLVSLPLATADVKMAEKAADSEVKIELIGL